MDTIIPSADRPENCNLNVKNCQKLAIKKITKNKTIFGNKKASFCQFFLHLNNNFQEGQDPMVSITDLNKWHRPAFAYLQLDTCIKNGHHNRIQL